MKKGLIILLGGLLAGAGAYLCVYLSCTSTHRAISRSDQPTLAWLQHECQLNDEQFARVKQLHEGYLPGCMERCSRVEEKNAQLQQLMSATNVVTPQIRQVLAEAAQLRADCQSSMLEHFYSVAKVMSPDQGQRYLSWVRQELLGAGASMPDHSKTPATVQPAASSHHGM